jgi:hypothetical protein
VRADGPERSEGDRERLPFDVEIIELTSSVALGFEKRFAARASWFASISLVRYQNEVVCAPSPSWMQTPFVVVAGADGGNGQL